MIRNEQFATADTLSKVAQALAVTSNKDGLERVFVITESLLDDEARALALVGVAQSFAAIGEDAKAVEIAYQAIKLAKTIKNTSWQFSVLCQAAQLLAQLGFAADAKAQIDLVLKSAGMFDDQLSMIYALSKLAQGLVSSGEIVKAAVVANKMSVLAWNWESLIMAACTLFVAGEHVKALENTHQALVLARMIPYGSNKVHALTSIARHLLESNQQEKAASVALEALSLAKPIIDDDNWLEEDLYEVIQVAADAGEFSQAIGSIDAIRDEALKLHALVGVANALASAEKYWQALELADIASEVVEKIEDVSLKVDTLVDLAQLLVKVREQARAVIVIDQAIELLGTIEVKSWNKFSLVRLSRVLIQVDEMMRALKIADAIEDIKNKMDNLIEIAQILAQAGKNDQALGIANRVLSLSQLIRNKLTKAQALAQIAEILDQTGENAKAQNIAKQTMEIAVLIEDRKEKMEALRGLARTFIKMGQHKEALAAWRTELDIAKLFGRREVCYVLAAGASLLADTNNSSALWETSETIMELLERE